MVKLLPGHQDLMFSAALTHTAPGSRAPASLSTEGVDAGEYNSSLSSEVLDLFEPKRSQMVFESRCKALRMGDVGRWDEALALLCPIVDL